ncbi:MAG: hypothetical protein HYZ54_14790 [Ignavibacteriae bacterium]|nr:hypothetical protein [Ignavibacteriota bacterium]
MKILFLLTATLLFTSISFAADSKKPVLVLSVSPIKVKQGTTVNAKLTIKVPKKWHIYGVVPKINKDGIGPQATEITLKDSTKSVVLGEVRSPKPKVEYDDGFEMDVESLEGALNFTLPITVEKSAALGKYKPSINVYFQLCNGKTCLTPEENTVLIPIEITK